eukprot:TRINITY_DN4059_c0_g1_i1.p1 TRINITY_DN4059_c0_g1~~TRINITY_DN4059_c0_g1_i1.p1  ORF type:complete len:205 (+),score=21.81 TRINITY_DN4059_c0_g1_i1:30-617(+)
MEVGCCGSSNNDDDFDGFTPTVDAAPKVKGRRNCFKVALVGRYFGGKTCIGIRRCIGQFGDVPPTVGGSFFPVTEQCENRRIKLEVWDTAGAEKYSSLTKMYYRNCDLIILVYAIDDIRSYNSLETWLSVITKECEKMPIIYIVGTKIDLGEDARVVSKQEASEWAAKKGVSYYISFVIYHSNQRVDDLTKVKIF